MKKPLKIIISVVLCIGVVVLAALLPAAILHKHDGSALVTQYPGEDLTVSSQGIKRAEFLAKTMHYPGAYKVEHQEAANHRQAALDARFVFAESSQVPDFLLTDMSVLSSSANAEDLTYISDSGDKLPLTHIYLEWKGDWSNWLEAYIDRDSGKVLYIYISGRCLVGNEKYAQMYPSCPSPEVIGEAYASSLGYTLGQHSVSQDPNENAIQAELSDGVNSVSYKINCIYYAGTMYDIKIAPLS